MGEQKTLNKRIFLVLFALKSDHPSMKTRGKLYKNQKPGASVQVFLAQAGTTGVIPFQVNFWG